MSNIITQLSISQSLTKGNYDGYYKIIDLMEKFNFGLGSLEDLDGEFLLNGKNVFQLKNDGSANLINNNIGTPFGIFGDFLPTFQFESFEEINSLNELYNKIEFFFPEKNLPLMIKLIGEFSYCNYRSLPKQSKPYPPLPQIIKNLPNFSMENFKGTIIAFRFPQYFSNLNCPGYHIHFISENCQFGGHILDLKLKNYQLFISESNEFKLLLPDKFESFTNKIF